VSNNMYNLIETNVQNNDTLIKLGKTVKHSFVKKGLDTQLQLYVTQYGIINSVVKNSTFVA